MTNLGESCFFQNFPHFESKCSLFATFFGSQGSHKRPIYSKNLLSLRYGIEKIKKIHPKKISYISGNINPDNFFYISRKETKRSYISGKGNPKKLLILQEVTFRARKSKKFFILFLNKKQNFLN